MSMRGPSPDFAWVDEAMRLDRWQGHNIHWHLKLNQESIDADLRVVKQMCQREQLHLLTIRNEVFDILRGPEFVFGDMMGAQIEAEQWMFRRAAIAAWNLGLPLSRGERVIINAIRLEQIDRIIEVFADRARDISVVFETVAETISQAFATVPPWSEEATTADSGC